MIRIPLFESFPGLAAGVPHRPLLAGPTPVQRAWRFGTTIGCRQFWIKRDDQTHPGCGGSKVRGLEFLLGQAQHRPTLLVVGPNGSNHLVATAYHAIQFGHRVVAATFPQPWTELVERNQRMIADLGVEQIPAPSLAALPGAVWKAGREIWRRDRSWPYLMPPGGTSPLSCLGYVNAALELAEQVRGGQMPEPDLLFVPVGTGGTLAGLLLGIRLANLKTDVIGIRVANRLVSNAINIAWLYNRTRALIAGHHPVPLPAPRLYPHQVALRHDCCGPGYGLWTHSGLVLLRRMAREEGIELDGTYTAKALDGLGRTIRERRWQKRVILFWNTYGIPA